VLFRAWSGADLATQFATEMQPRLGVWKATWKNELVTSDKWELPIEAQADCLCGIPGCGGHEDVGRFHSVDTRSNASSRRGFSCFIQSG
jgi:hypothetical protein